MAGQPQTITRHGTSAVVVVAAADWQRHTNRMATLAELSRGIEAAAAGKKRQRL
jgi:toxin FitB